MELTMNKMYNIFLSGTFFFYDCKRSSKRSSKRFSKRSSLQIFGVLLEIRCWTVPKTPLFTFFFGIEEILFFVRPCATLCDFFPIPFSLGQGYPSPFYKKFWAWKKLFDERKAFLRHLKISVFWCFRLGKSGVQVLCVSLLVLYSSAVKKW